MTNVLGIDLGEKNIGLAIGSNESKLSRPLEVFTHKSRRIDIDHIIRVIKSHQISRIVIGISFQEDGLPNSMGKHALSFGRELEQSSGLPIEYCDEALSTQDAKSQAIRLGASTKQRRGHLDAAAAAFILQSYFDRYSNGSQ